MAKNIVICCDGTSEEYGDNNSNVVKLYSLLENSAQQVTYYHPGLGTMGSKYTLSRILRLWTKLKGLAFGYGLMDDVSDAYVFLMNECEEGDRVFLFGFSRGAYTVRALAAFLHMFGLMHRGNDSLVPYAIRRFKSKIRNEKPFKYADGFKQTFSRVCKPYFLGVWDTVSSVGWIYDPLHLPFTARNPDVQICRHAVSIDERRCQFRDNLWTPLPGQDSKQLWFAGTHCDIGGGLGTANSGLSDITLNWMYDQAVRAGLRVQGAPASAGDPSSIVHNPLTLPWLPLELLPKRYMDMRYTPPKLSWRIPLGRKRYIPEDSVFHISVKQRMDSVKYSLNLPAKYSFEGELRPQVIAAGEGRAS